MRFLRTNTAIRLTVGPFYDKTDGVTPEVAITVTSCKLTLMVDDGNVPTLVLDTNPTASGGANDMVHVSGDDAGFYDLELAAANVNYLGRAMLAITDAATHCPVFHEFMVLPAMIYDAMVLGTDVLQVDITQLLGTAHLAPGTAGTPDVNAKLAGGTAWGSGAITAGSIAATALNGKGDWNIGKTGYALSAAGVQAIWDALTSALTTASSIGKLLVDNINATISSRSSHVAADIWAVATRVLTAGTNIVLAKGTGVTGFNDLSAVQVNAEADTAIADAALATAANLATVAGYIDTEVAATLAAVLNLVAAGYTRTGTAAAGAAGAITLDAGASAVDDFYNNQVIVIASGTGVGQARFISDYVGATKVATVATWATNPDNTSVFYLLPFGAIPGATAPTAAEVRQEIDNNSTQLAAIKAKTDNLPSDPADESLLIAATNSILAAIAALNNLSQANIRTAVGLASANLDTQLDALPTNAELATALATADDAVLAAIAALNNLSQANIRTAIGLASANLDTQLDALPTNAELSTALAAADDAVLAAIAALNNVSAAAVNAQCDIAIADAALATAAALSTAQAAITAVKAKTDNLPASPAAIGSAMTLAAGAVSAAALAADAVDEILDEAIGDGTLTMRQALRVLVAGMAGKIDGAATTEITIRNLADSADVIVATVDADGNRTAVTVTP